MTVKYVCAYVVQTGEQLNKTKFMRFNYKKKRGLAVKSQILYTYKRKSAVFLWRI